MEDYDAKLGIYSDQNTLVDKLKTKFTDKYLNVTVFNDFNKVDSSKLSYIIINLLDNKKNYAAVQRALRGVEAKIIVLHPLYVRSDDKDKSNQVIKSFLEINNNIGVILVPDILGKDVLYNDEYLSHQLIMQSILSERVKIINSGVLVNTVSISSLADRIVKELFSFGISGQSLGLIGPRKGMKTFLTKYLGLSDENIIETKGEVDLVELNHTSSVMLDFSLRFAVNATRNTFSLDVSKKQEKTVERPVVSKPASNLIANKVEKPQKKVNRFFGWMIKSLFVVLAVLVAPMVTLIISATLLYASVKYSVKDISLSERLSKYSSNFTELSSNISLGIPVYYDYANIMHKGVVLFRETLELTTVGKEFGMKIMGDEAYDLASYSDNISAILDRIHTDFGFLQSDINELDDLFGTSVKKYLLGMKVDIGNYKSKVYFVRSFFSRLTTLLGNDKPMKYLVLFQNNMELRPTGGFIGSFALISFNKGRLTEIVVSDVYSADGQLKGHVDPPQAIRDHLREGGWYLRDSNWDPNFPDSAIKAEWFLDKEINTQVDGVVSVDLNFIQNLLKITGPINLVDFNKTITADNLYVSTQSEVEANFFPGSIKKASFMTSLSKQLITELENLESDKYFSLVKEIYNSLESRHVQLYFHDLNAQSAISSLGYSGEITLQTDCGARCYEDKYMLVDANMGVNKANFFVRRAQDLKVNVSKSSINHELLTTYTNTANRVLGTDGIYKNYARLVLPLDSKVVGIRVYDMYGGYEDLKYDVYEMTGRREVGFLINVLPDEAKKIQVVWNTPTNKLENGGEYRLTVQKQSGTIDDDLKVMVQKSDLSLTGRAPSVYTTTLSRDFKTLLFFKP